MVNVWLWGFLVFELKVQKEQKQIWNESLMIRTFEVKYEFAETELRWQDFFFPGTIVTTNHVIWVSSTTPAGRIRFWIVTLSLPCDLYHISVCQHLCSHRYETWTERSEVPQYDYDHTVHWHGPSDNSSKKKRKELWEQKTC